MGHALFEKDREPGVKKSGSTLKGQTAKKGKGGLDFQAELTNSKPTAMRVQGEKGNIVTNSGEELGGGGYAATCFGVVGEKKIRDQSGGSKACGDTWEKKGNYPPRSSQCICGKGQRGCDHGLKKNGAKS